jgi:hypothetical protein
MSFQSYPQSVYPDTGDVTSATGDSSLVVTGIQRVPVEAVTPLDQQSIVFQASVGTGEYVPTYSPFNRSVQVNGVAVSDDYWIAVNLSLGPASTPVSLNGSLV